LKTGGTAFLIYRTFYSRRAAGGTHTPDPPCFANSQPNLQTTPNPHTSPLRQILLRDRTASSRSRQMAAASPPAPPRAAESTPFCVRRSDQTVWRRLRSRLADCLSMCSVDESMATPVRVGDSMCARDRMRLGMLKLVRIRLHREGSGRALARVSSSPSRWSLTFANGTTSFDFRVGIGYVNLKLTGAQHAHQQRQRTHAGTGRKEPASIEGRRRATKATN